jgi:hypothetical protein
MQCQFKSYYSLPLLVRDNRANGTLQRVMFSVTVARSPKFQFSGQAYYSRRDKPIKFSYTINFGEIRGMTA